MVKQVIWLKDYSWRVFVYYPIRRYHIREIMNQLILLDTPIESLDRAYEIMTKNRENTGFTFSSASKRETLVMIARTSSKRELANSIAHEQGHIAVHIAEALNINPTSESFCYLLGEIAEEMYPTTSRLLCGCKDHEAIMIEGIEEDEDEG